LEYRFAVPKAPNPTDQKYSLSDGVSGGMDVARRRTEKKRT
jgi:hypothetical protein